MIGLSVDATIDLPKALHKKKPLAYLQGFMGQGDPYQTVREAYGIRGIPSIWLIGPDGTIIARDLRGRHVLTVSDSACHHHANQPSI